MNRLTNLTPAEKKFLDDAIAAAERASGKKLNQPNRHIVLNRARAQIESQRYADRQRALREDERWIGPYISIHFLSLNPLLVRRRRYSRGERYPSALCGCHSL